MVRGEVLREGGLCTHWAHTPGPLGARGHVSFCLGSCPPPRPPGSTLPLGSGRGQRLLTNGSCPSKPPLWKPRSRGPQQRQGQSRGPRRPRHIESDPRGGRGTRLPLLNPVVRCERLIFLWGPRVGFLHPRGAQRENHPSSDYDAHHSDAREERGAGHLVVPQAAGRGRPRACRPLVSRSGASRGPSTVTAGRLPRVEREGALRERSASKLSCVVPGHRRWGGRRGRTSWPCDCISTEDPLPVSLFSPSLGADAGDAPLLS